jgi:hypothetical protein
MRSKLKWCEEAVETASYISVHGKEQAPVKVARFWELYWGVMGMVENKQWPEFLLTERLLQLFPKSKDFAVLACEKRQENSAANVHGIDITCLDQASSRRSL